MVGVGGAPCAVVIWIVVVGSLTPVLRREQSMWCRWSVDRAWNLELMEEPIIVLDLPANCSNVGTWNVAANSNDVDGDGIRRSEEVVDAVCDALGGTIIDFDLEGVRIEWLKSAGALVAHRCRKCSAPLPRNE